MCDPDEKMCISDLGLRDYRVSSLFGDYPVPLYKAPASDKINYKVML
jgi:hypothetical protein